MTALTYLALWLILAVRLNGRHLWTPNLADRPARPEVIPTVSDSGRHAR